MRILCLIFMSAMVLTACNDATVCGDTVALPKNVWKSSNVIEFTIPKLDSIQSHNLFFTIRNTNEYPFSNLYLIATLKFPYGKTVVDTLEYKMANPDGSWLGTGIGSVKESKLYYKENFIFNESGNYQLAIAHAVRNNGEVEGVLNLEGISDVGYSIEKVKK